MRRVAPWLLAALLLLAFIGLAAWQVFTWLELTGTPEAAGNAAPPSATATPDLERLNVLFGNAPAAQAPSGGGTQISVVLHGSFVSANPQRSSAVLQVNDQPAKRYRVGDELARGIVLHQVDANQVQLRRNGRLETLAFPKPGSEPPGMAPQPLPEPPPAQGEPPAPAPEAAPESIPQAPSSPPPGVLQPPPEAVPDVPGARTP